MDIRSTSRFRFAPLENPASEIRLLELLPGLGTVSCRLVHTSLEASSGQYEPLSYCWGDQAKRADILIDGLAFSVGVNLHKVLRRLRFNHDVRVLWVDALCINQEDVLEKSTQVPFITRIFKCGRRTLAWLGENDSRTRSAFGIIEFMARYNHDYPSESRRCMDEWADLYRREHRVLLLPFSRLQTRILLKSLNSVFNRPWFRRVWIIQELAVSLEVLVLCGSFQANWETIEAAYLASKENWEDATSNYLTKLDRQRWDFQNDKRVMMDSKLLMAASSEATDPRDHVYAVLGLIAYSKYQQRDIEVHYGAGIEGPFKEVTERCLSTGRSHILAASVGSSGKILTGLPSWALYPNKTEPGDTRLTELATYTVNPRPIWKASGASTCKPVTDHENRSRIGLLGHLVGRVSATGSTRMPLSSAPSILGLARWSQSVLDGIQCYLEWRRLAYSIGSQFYRDTNEPILEAFRKALYAVDAGLGRDINQDNYTEAFREFDHFVTTKFSFLTGFARNQLRTRDKLQGHSKSLGYLFRFMLINNGRDTLRSADRFQVDRGWTVGRKFVVTENGYIGIASNGTREGDVVVLLAGAQTPFILRRDGDDFLMRGECYIHGIMEGQAWDESLCETIWMQ